MPMIPIDPASITPAWLSEVLAADVRGCEVEQIAVGVGLLGRLYRVHLKGEPDVPATVVVKLPTLDAKVRVGICEEFGFYLREVRFYEEIGLDNPLRPALPYFAAFDAATHDFVLVLEDLNPLRHADQTVGCSAEDAATVIDAVALHHAHWWDNDRLASLSWLDSYDTPMWRNAVLDNYTRGWSTFVERVGSGLSPAVLAFGEKLPSLVPWFLAELSRPPVTFCHGDLRLDQLFFANSPGDPPVTALDWQVTGKGRGAYDVAYFLTQSLTPDTRRGCESQLIERYREHLAEHGIEYPRAQLLRDYQMMTAVCFAYPVIAAGRVDIANDRQLDLLQAMTDGAALAIEDHDCLSLRPD